MTVAFETRLLQAVERGAEALVGIRAILDEMTTMPEPESVSTECLHPLDQRIPFGRTGGEEDWQCKVCGYRVSDHYRMSDRVEVPVHA